MAWRDWVRTVEIEPSLLAADFAHLGEQVQYLLNAGARVFHFDVGDGHFVPPITMGPPILRSIAPMIHRMDGYVDCHLMVDNPAHHFAQIKEAGGDSVTFHVEAVEDVSAVIARAREHELGVGVAFNPHTDVEVAAEAANLGADICLCMTVVPGYGGQDLLEGSYERIAKLRGLVDCLVQADGGIHQDNVREVNDAGADLIVVGTGIFDREDLPRAYRRLVQALA
jgi:ribulose-phosphate 3-epimerase